jgi:hypothetical protein
MRCWQECVERYEQARFESASDRACDRHCGCAAGECCKCALLVCPAERLARCCCSYLALRDSPDAAPLLRHCNSMLQARGDV